MQTINIVEEIQKNLTTGTVVEYSEIQAELASLREKFGTVVPDCSNKEGYEFSKNAALTCREIRTNLEAIRKDKKEPYLNYGRLIDSQAKEIKEAIELIEWPHKEAYQHVDAEKKRILEERKQVIFDLNNSRAWALEQSPESIAARIEDIECMDISKESFGRQIDEAMAAQATALDVLASCYADAVNKRAEEARIASERAELEALREEQRKRDEAAAAAEAERQRLEREAEITRQAEARAMAQAAEAEARAIREKEEAEHRAAVAEQARIDAENRAALEATAAAERARLQEVERQKQEQERIEAEAAAREADKKHRAAINNAVKGALIAGGLSTEAAELATKLIAARKVPHTSISY